MALALALSVNPSLAAIDDTTHFRVLGMLVVWGADGQTGGQAPIVSDFIVNTGTGTRAATSGDRDLIAADAFTVVTGSLDPVADEFEDVNGMPIIIQNPLGRANFSTDTNNDRVLDASDAFSAFSLRSTTDMNLRLSEISSSFYVASNVPFTIEAQARKLGATSDFSFNRMRMWLTVTASGNDGLAFGSAAQLPHSAGATGGISATNRRLNTLVTPQIVFRGDRRTARVRGTLAEQSVRFNIRYRYNDGPYDLSEGAYDATAEVVYTLFIP
jgi:hypothetical protein